jgi:hypothetical protein
LSKEKEMKKPHKRKHFSQIRRILNYNDEVRARIREAQITREITQELMRGTGFLSQLVSYVDTFASYNFLQDVLEESNLIDWGFLKGVK